MRDTYDKVDSKYNKIPNRIHRTKEYNNWT